MTVTRLEKKLGIKASDTASISFNDCRVPAANLLGNAEVDVQKGFAGVMETFDNTRPLVAGMAVGVAKAALDRTRELLKKLAASSTTGNRCSPSATPRPLSIAWRRSGRQRAC